MVGTAIGFVAHSGHVTAGAAFVALVLWGVMRMDEDSWEKQKVETEKHALLRNSQRLDEGSCPEFAGLVLAETVLYWGLVTGQRQ